MDSEFLYGINTAEEILTAGKRKVYRLLISRSEKGERIKKIASLAREKGLRPEFCDTKILEKYASGGNHQGIILEASPIKKMTLEEAIEENKKHPKTTIWAALDGITDPMNLGAIIRSAACLGVSVIVLPERRSASLTAAAQKTASGAAERINIIEVTNLNQTIIKLKENGFWIYGLDMKGKSLPETDFVFPALIVIGAEGDGLHQKTGEHCDEIISIPQKGGVESLNAGNAAAIAFYEVSKKIRV